MEGVISQLPEEIIHHILSFMETKEAARTSLFCKAWHAAWLTCPALNFGGRWRYIFSTPKTKEKVLKFMKSTLQRYQQEKIHIVQLTIPIIIGGTSIVDEWIGFAVQNGVERLELCKFAALCELSAQTGRPSSYALPQKLFEAKTLRELAIFGVNLSGRRNKIMFNNLYLQSSLHSLHLSYVYISNDMFQGIIQRCPLIDDLLVEFCHGLARIKVNNLRNLRKFSICTLGNEPVEIDAPYLQYLHCVLPPSCCHSYTTQVLKYLSISGSLWPIATVFDNLTLNLPQLEDLRLTTCYGQEKINISSHSLKRITLKGILALEGVKINAPNLLSFEFCLAYKTFLPDISLTNISSQLESKISEISYELNTCDQICKMKEFLFKLLPSKISLDLRSNGAWRFGAVKKIPFCPVINVEDLHLNHSFLLESTLTNFLDALFMTCHPKAIKLGRYDGKATKLLYHNLIARRNQGLLKGVRLEIYDETKCEWLCYKVCIRLEWEAYYAL